MTRRMVLAMATFGWAVQGMAQGAKPLPYGSTDMYQSILTIEADGVVPDPTIAPVYDGHVWGLSTRWDDSNPNALNIRRKMMENGIRGSFYLNSRKPEKPEGSLARKLADRGICSVGGHSVSHPKLPQLPANDVLYQLLDNRIALECLTDQPVNSLAFPYGQYQAKDRPEVLQGVSEAFLRTSYSHCVYSGFVLRNRNLPAGVVTTGVQVQPGDRKVEEEKFFATMDKIHADPAKYRKTSDCIFLGVHPWQTGQELEKLGEVMAKLRDWDDFWHCTQTEWAAYAKQRHDTKVQTTKPGTYQLTRPAAFDLGNAVPLTLVFDTESVRAAKVDGVACPVRHADGKTYVNVPHDSLFGVPVKIDRADGNGVCAKFPGLKATLSVDPKTKEVSCALQNNSDAAVELAVVTFALPPACDPGLLRSHCTRLAQGDTWSVAVPAEPVREGEYWTNGKPYFAAQIDFRQNGKRGRIFATHVGPAVTN